MKLLIIFIFSLFIGWSLQGQNYEVVHLQGNIQYQSSSPFLKKESQFKKQDKLVFNKSQDWIIALELNTKKNYIIRPKKNSQNQVVSDFQLLPYKIQNRPGYILSGVDLVKYLNEGNNYLVIGKETIIPVNRNGFPMNQDTFFYLNYDYHGISINKKLSIVEDGILLNKDSLFQVRFTKEEYYRKILKNAKYPIAEPERDTFIQIDPAQITIQEHQYLELKNFNFDTVSYRTNVALHYFDGAGGIPIKAPANPNTSTLINRPFLPFNLIFLEDEVVNQTIEPLLASEFLKTDEKPIERLTAFLEEQFNGKLEERDVKKWLEDDELLKSAEPIQPIVPLHHTESVNQLDIHPNNKTLLSASNDGTIKLWDIPSGLLKQSLQAHQGRVNTACFSPDGQYIASAGSDNAIRLWKEGEDKPIQEFIGHSIQAWSLAISKNNKWLVSASQDKTIKLWDLKTGQCLRTFIGHENVINAVCFSQDGQSIISGSGFVLGIADNTIRIWNIHTGENTKTLNGHEDSITDLDVSPDGKYIVSSSDDATIRIWDMQTGREEKILNESAAVSAVQFSPDGNFIISGAVNQAIRLWNWKKETIEHTYLGHRDFINSVIFSADGKYIFSTADDILIKMWSKENGQVLRTFEGQFKPVYATTYSNNGRYLLTSSLTGSIKLWDMRTGHYLQTFVQPEGFIGANRLAFTADNERFISSHINMFGNQVILFWEVSTGKLLFQLEGHQEVINDFEISADENYLVSCASDEVKIWDIKKSKQGRVIPSQQKGIMTVNFIKNQNQVLVGATDGSLKVFQFDGTLVQSFKGHLERIMATAISPDGTQILAGGGKVSSSELILWDKQNGKMIRHFQSSHNNFINCMDISPDGKQAVTGAFDGTICLWNLKQALPLVTFDKHTDYLTDVHFSPDGQYIISSSGDNTTRIWSVKNRSLLLTLFSLDNKEWGVVSEAGYYSCSKELAQKMGFRLGKEFYPFEQFDLKYNRPDLVAADMPFKDNNFIQAYQRAYQKRLEKLGISEEMLSESFTIPEIEVLPNDLPTSTQKEAITFQVKAKDEKTQLKRLSVFVNDVPIYGNKGIDLLPFKSNKIEQNITVKLSEGPNKIQFSVLNQAGIESLKKTIRINCDAPKKQTNLYLIGIGVEDFADEDLNLTYPIKDIRNFIQLYQHQTTQYEKIIVDTLFNQTLTKEGLQKIKTKLYQSNIDDHVILMVSGHGIIDSRLDYYFATSKMDFSKPQKEGILYKDLENLLDNIPARNKLFLMDACHSGEIDKATVEVIKKDNTRKKEVKFKRAFNQEVTYQKLGLENSFELMKQLFVDLRRSTGTTVISSASGVEFAWEGEEWQNSVFTYCLLSGLKENKADKNQDGQIMVSELQQYLAKEVAKLTNNHQQPTMRVENISNNWQVW